MNTGEPPQLDKKKPLQKKTTANVKLNGKLNVFFSKIRKKKRISTLITIFNTVLEVLASTITWEKENKRTYLKKKEMKLSLFADGMMTYEENPKESTKNS